MIAGADERFVGGLIHAVLGSTGGLVVPTKEMLAVSASIFDRSEAIREVGSVLESFELRLRVRIIVRDVWAAVSSHSCLRQLVSIEE
jgi:hypothetical protein